MLGGIGLIALPRMSDAAHALGTVAVIGAANVFAIRGGQMVLLRHFIPIGQRAIAASIAAITALMAPLGMLAGYLLIVGLGPLKPVGLENALILSGAGVVLCGAITAVQMIMPNAMAPVETIEDIAAGMEGAAEDWDDEYDDDEEDAYEDSRRYPRARGGRARYDDSDRYSTYSGAYPAYSDEYEAPRRRSRYDDEDDDESAPRPRFPRR